MPASTDPTVQTKGTLSVGLKLDYNATSNLNGNVQGMNITAGPIAYGPSDQPPPAWTQGTQYYSGNGTAYGAMGLVPRGGYWYQAGIYAAVYVYDMSSNAVLTGKTYAFTFSLGSQWIQLYVRVTGGPNGSTVLPGFGLWSLGNNPHAWTYVTPEEFTGEWMIGLLSPASFSVMWLSAEYAPPKDYGSGLESRLVFTVSGLYRTDVAQPSEQQAVGPKEIGLEPNGIQHLHERSHPHILHSGPGVPVG